MLILFALRLRDSVARNKQSMRAFGHPRPQAGERQKGKPTERGDERNPQAQLNSLSYFRQWLLIPTFDKATRKTLTTSEDPRQ